jgi:hypothetical protein
MAKRSWQAGEIDMDECLWVIMKDLEVKPKVAIFEAFVKEFGDIHKATVLSEICVYSMESLKKDEKAHGWFCRTYDGWEVITGIPKTSAREACTELVLEGFIQTELRVSNGSRVTHFRAVPENILKLISGEVDEVKTNFGPCPLCKKAVFEGRTHYYCSAWRRDDSATCHFSLKKAVLQHLGKDNISHTEIRKLLLKVNIDLEGLTNPKKPQSKPFSCKGALEQSENGWFGIKFIFPEPKKASDTHKEAANG